MDYHSPPHEGPPPGEEGGLHTTHDKPAMDINMLSFQPLPPPTQDSQATSPPHQQYFQQQQVQFPQQPPHVAAMPPPQTPQTQQVAKPKPPRKRKSSSAKASAAVAAAAAASAAAATASDESSSSSSSVSSLTPSQNKCKDLRAYVVNLLSHKESGFSDVEFAERALMNIARKISSSPHDMEEWRRAVVCKDAKAGCVSIVRPKDGRLTIARPHANSTKKVFPQVLLCQAFRWPHIVFHNDVKPAPECSHQTVVKPPEKVDPASGAPEEYVCINPFHYVMTTEATARFNKQARKRGGSKSKAKLAKVQQAASKALKDEGFSESEPIDFDDKGVDLIKMWDNKKSSGKGEIGTVRKFNDQEILDDIKLLSLSTGKPLEREERLKLLAKLKRTILSGEYLNGHDVREDNFDMERALREVKARVEERRRASGDTGPPEPSTSSPSDSAVAAMSVDEDSQKSGSGGGPADDSAIQDLLDDIRGSFERQFDHEFENLSAEDLEAAAAAASDTTEAFSGIEATSFNMVTNNYSSGDSSGGEQQQAPPPPPPLSQHLPQQQRQQQYQQPPVQQQQTDAAAAAAALSLSGGMYDPGSAVIAHNRASSSQMQQQPQQPAMPCIVDSWTMGTGDGVVSNNAYSMGQPQPAQGDYNSYYSPQQQQSQHPISSPDSNMMYAGQQQHQYNPQHTPQHQSMGTPYHHSQQQHYPGYDAAGGGEYHHQ